jgi:Tfp pilus assembly protein PilV
VNGARGFTLVETAVATVLAATFGFALLGVARELVSLSATAATARDGALTLETQADEMRSAATTAFAVFVPQRDVMRATNERDGTTHEVDFFARTNSGASVRSAYYFDATAHTLRRYDYDGAGKAGVADRATGAIDAGATYPALSGVTRFDARTLQASDLVGPRNAYAAAIAPPFAGATPRALPVGFVDGTVTRPDLYGGNTTVDVRIETAHDARTLHLATTSMPSGFTVHAPAQIRAVVYRVDQTHRFWGGLAGKSHVFVKARLDVSYDGWKTPARTWCDFDLYGFPGGLTGGTAEDYHPEWFTETTAGIVYDVTHGETPGATCPLTPPARR